MSGCDVCRDAPKPEGMRVRCKACGTMYGENAHVCHATRCNAKVPPKMLMCLKHWRLVPRDLQRRVWAAYVPGQEIRKDPTPTYLDAMMAAIEAVDNKERAALAAEARQRVLARVAERAR